MKTPAMGIEEALDVADQVQYYTVDGDDFNNDEGIEAMRVIRAEFSRLQGLEARLPMLESEIRSARLVLAALVLEHGGPLAVPRKALQTVPPGATITTSDDSLGGLLISVVPADQAAER